jgi:hypothetical protein
MRPRLLAGGIALVVAGAAVAALPFGITIDLPNGGGQAAAGCRSPAFAAWNRQPKGQLALWVVNDLNKGSVTHEVRFGAEPYCAGQARVRVGVAAGLMALGLGMVFLARRLTA